MDNALMEAELVIGSTRYVAVGGLFGRRVNFCAMSLMISLNCSQLPVYSFRLLFPREIQH